MLVKLLDLTAGNRHPFGNNQGRDVFKKLRDVVDSHPSENIFEISLEGILATDSSFPRECVISLAKQLRGEKWFYLTHFSTIDLVDNWDYGAKAKQQPLIIWTNGKPKVIGPDLKSSTQELLFFVLKRGCVSAADVAKGLNISVPNASTRLKRLVNEGLILRSEESALTGGIEYIYSSAKHSD